MREVASILNVRLITSAADSLFQNGLCEHVHSVIDMKLLKLMEENRKLKVKHCCHGQIWHETPYKRGMVSVAIN